MHYYVHVFKCKLAFFVWYFAFLKSNRLHIISKQSFKKKLYFSLSYFVFVPFHFRRTWSLIEREKSLLQPSTNVFFLRFHLWASQTVYTPAGWWAPLGKAGPLLQCWWVHVLIIANLLRNKLCSGTAFFVINFSGIYRTLNTADLPSLLGCTVSSIGGFSGADCRLCLNC